MGLNREGVEARMTERSRMDLEFLRTVNHAPEHPSGEAVGTAG
jgi:hypothetical protein